MRPPPGVAGALWGRSWGLDAARISGVRFSMVERFLGARMPRTERKLRNQALFREVNQRIAELSEKLDDLDQGEQPGFVCECSELGCAELVGAPLDVYDRARDDPTLFLVLKGHEDLSHDAILEDLGAYLIVRTDASA